MESKQAISGFGIILFWLVFASCILVSSPVRAAQNQGGPPYMLQIGTVVPGQMGWAQRAKEVIIPFADRISDGQLEIRVFWGGIRGDDDDILQQVKAGKLQGGAFSGYGASLVCPEFSVVSLPFLFEDYGEVDFIRRSMSPTFEKLFEKHGFALFLWVDQDFDQLYSSNLPMTRLEHFREAVFIQWFGDLEKELFRAWASPYQPARISQVYQVFGTGRVTAAMGPAMWALGSQLYPKARYISRLNVRYSPVAVAVSLDFWNRLPAAHRQRAMDERAPIVDRFVAFSREDAQQCIQAMLSYGLRETQVGPADLPQLKAIARTSWQRLSGKMFPQQLLDEVLAYLEQYRAVNQGGGSSK